MMPDSNSWNGFFLSTPHNHDRFLYSHMGKTLSHMGKGGRIFFLMTGPFSNERQIFPCYFAMRCVPADTWRLYKVILTSMHRCTNFNVTLYKRHDVASTNGVKQGFVLTSTLFSMMFSAMFTDAFQDGDNGIPIRETFQPKQVVSLIQGADRKNNNKRKKKNKKKTNIILEYFPF